MNLDFISTELINLEKIDTVETKGKTGINIAKEYNLKNIRIGLFVYSANYKSAEWCDRRHIIHCIEGEMIIRLKSGNDFKLSAGNSLLLNENDSHIAVTGNSTAKIFIVD